MVKDQVFRRKPNTVEELTVYTEEAFHNQDNIQLCMRVCQCVPGTLGRCINTEGKQFEGKRS